jgi:nicotinate-nucleotide adenylyltransferase
MTRPQRIAIYGGTFDPVHRGHLEIARRISPLFGLDSFLFVPAKIAPHKLGRKVLPALHRYAMLALATNDEPRIKISRFEIEGPGPQYTVDTLLHFREKFGESAELFFVLGTDSWLEITSWRAWRQLCSLADLIVVTRPGYAFSAEHVDDETATGVIDLRGLTADAFAGAIARPGQKIFVSDAVMVDVSATQIREASSRSDNEKLEELVPPAVAEYIRKYQLYRNTHEA